MVVLGYIVGFILVGVFVCWLKDAIDKMLGLPSWKEETARIVREREEKARLKREKTE